MPTIRLLLVPIVLATVTAPASAGIFSRKPKPNPAERVPELVQTLKWDADESKRTAAAEELRQYDAKAYPDILTALSAAVLKDSSANVRTAAADSLAKVRPVSQPAGWALEQALANDKSMRVRFAARTALWQYHLHGYHSTKPPEKPVQSDEPPLATAPRPAAKPVPKVLPIPRGGESPEPPLAVPPAPPPAPTPVVPPAPPLVVPVPTPLPQGTIPTPPAAESEGPPLLPPG